MFIYMQNLEENKEKNLTHTVFSVGFQVDLAEAKCQHILLRLGI